MTSSSRSALTGNVGLFRPSYEHSVEGKHVTVIGFGRSGSAAAKLAARKGATSVVIQDKRDAVEIGEERVLEVARDGMRLELGAHRVETLKKSNIIVVSPGVPSIPELREAEEAGVLVISEIELASWYIDAPVLAVTGTNGKSTVTALAGEMMKASGIAGYLRGRQPGRRTLRCNRAAGGAPSSGAIVLELSSYQLERTYTLSPARRGAHQSDPRPSGRTRYRSLAQYGAARAAHLSEPDAARSQRRARRAARDGGHGAGTQGRRRVHMFGGSDSAIKVIGNDGIVDESGREVRARQAQDPADRTTWKTP